MGTTKKTEACRRRVTTTRRRRPRPLARSSSPSSSRMPASLQPRRRLSRRPRRRPRMRRPASSKQVVYLPVELMACTTAINHEMIPRCHALCNIIAHCHALCNIISLGVNIPQTEHLEHHTLTQNINHTNLEANESGNLSGKAEMQHNKIW